MRLASIKLSNKILYLFKKLNFNKRKLFVGYPNLVFEPMQLVRYKLQLTIFAYSYYMKIYHSKEK